MTPLYRAILEVFAASKRQFRLHLRPDDVLAEATWPGAPLRRRPSSKPSDSSDAGLQPIASKQPTFQVWLAIH